MKRLIIAAALLSTCCAPLGQLNGRSTAQLTTPGISALHAIEVGKGLDIIRDTAVNAETAKIITTADMLIIVRWHKSAALAIDQSPNGWRPMVLTGLDQLKKDVSLSTLKIVGPYIDASILVIKVVQ